jgi:SAM-dependent methyltransferase
MKQQLRSRVANGLDRIRLLGPAERVRAAWLSRRASRREEGVLAPDGLPLPPAPLRLLIDSRSGDAGQFLQVGSQMCEAIRRVVGEAGKPVEQMEAILDFGCGCGRVARHWAECPPQLYGCDYNPELVDWCAVNLPAGRFTRNDLAPPTSYEDESFDLIYALSVFSHLGEPLQRSWLEEFRRLLRPGGLLLLTVLGERMRERLAGDEARRFDSGEMIVQRPRMAGRNLCTVYHPSSYVHWTLLADFAEVRHVDLGSPSQPILQEAYLARL